MSCLLALLTFKVLSLLRSPPNSSKQDCTDGGRRRLYYAEPYIQAKQREYIIEYCKHHLSYLISHSTILFSSMSLSRYTVLHLSHPFILPFYARLQHCKTRPKCTTSDSASDTDAGLICRDWGVKVVRCAFLPKVLPFCLCEFCHRSSHILSLSPR